MTVLLSGCSLLPWRDGGAEVHEMGGGRVAIDEEDNTPTSAKRLVSTERTPDGRWQLFTHDSALGPCIEVVHADGTKDAQCMGGSGLSRKRRAHVNGAAWNYGLGQKRSAVGMVHWGLTLPDVAAVGVEAGGERRLFPTPWAHGKKVRGYLALTPRAWESYDLVGYDAQGCVVSREKVEIFGKGAGGGPDDAVVDPPDCSERFDVTKALRDR
jgi:hypothetical protein